MDNKKLAKKQSQQAQQKLPEMMIFVSLSPLIKTVRQSSLVKNQLNCT